MALLSIDVGIKNLAMCLIDSDTRVIHHWDVSGVPPEHADGLFKSMIRHLDERPWTVTARTVLIEKQPDKNRKMKMVEHLLQAYFLIKCAPGSEVHLYDARHKIPDVAGPGKAQYRKRKQTSIDRCREFLEAPDSVNGHWLTEFVKSKKKDDLADTVMQALSYLKRPENSSVKGPAAPPPKRLCTPANPQNTKRTPSTLNPTWRGSSRTRRGTNSNTTSDS